MGAHRQHGRVVEGEYVESAHSERAAGLVRCITVYILCIINLQAGPVAFSATICANDSEVLEQRSRELSHDQTEPS